MEHVIRRHSCREHQFTDLDYADDVTLFFFCRRARAPDELEAVGQLRIRYFWTSRDVCRVLTAEHRRHVRVHVSWPKICQQ